MTDKFGTYHVSGIPYLNSANMPAHSGISNFENVTLVRISYSYSTCFCI